MEKFLKFCFKGGRNYLHSTDVFNRLLKLFNGDIENINFSFYRITNKNILLKDFLDEKLNLVFLFEFTQNGEKKHYFGFEAEKPIDCRYEYNEDSITEDAFIQKNCAILERKSSYSFIEHLVALTKFLHLNLFPKKGKWYFARLQLERVPNNFIPLKVCLNQNLGSKLTVSNIYIGETPIGKIYFSLVG
jgi:hypothetical protein